MARQTGELEDASKAYPGKNAVTLFDESGTYSWDEFINAVLAEKYELIRDFFQTMQDYGKSFLYRLLDLMRSRDEKINLARYAYLRHSTFMYIPFGKTRRVSEYENQ